MAAGKLNSDLLTNFAKVNLNSFAAPKSSTEAEAFSEKKQEDLLVEHMTRLLDAPSLSEDEPLPRDLQDIPGVEALHNRLLGIRNLVAALSTGNLEYVCKERGFVAGSLKAFQSNLRHLTWQAGRIAEGEYHHRVNFMGDFSVAFNKMTEQLDNTINSLTKLSAKYKDLSYHDPLTGLYNRLAFSKYAAVLLEGDGGPPPQQSTLIMTDIDHFKKVNDTYGHPCGDAVLKAFASRLQSLLRSKELCCRYGGEEFILFLPGTPIETGMGVAKRLRAAVEAMSIEFEEHVLRITASFGACAVSSLPDGTTVDEHLKACIQAADDNLYKAKTGGRNRVVGPEPPPA
jgi:diguanylate cyclase (GGDEF)-like protein